MQAQIQRFELQIGIGRQLRNRGCYEEAVEKFHDVISQANSIGYEFPLPYYELGETYRLSGDYMQAMNNYDLALRYNPAPLLVGWVNRGKEQILNVRSSSPVVPEDNEILKSLNEIHRKLDTVTSLHEVINEVKVEINRNRNMSNQHKKEMQRQIDNMASKIENLANKSDVEYLTRTIENLMHEGKLTKNRITDLEKEIDTILKRQDRADERIKKLEHYQSVIEELRIQVDENEKANTRDKRIMQATIDRIIDKVANMADKADLEVITETVKNLIVGERITKGIITDLEDEIDGMIARINDHEQKLAEQKEILDDHDEIIIQLQERNEMLDSVIVDMQRKLKNNDYTGTDKIKVRKVIDYFRHIVSDDVLTLNPIIQNILENNNSGSLTKKMIILISDVIDNDERTICAVTGVTYKNVLLNYPDLLKGAIKLFGLDKALELGDKLDSSLIEEAISCEDFEVILAGMYSLGYEQ